MKTLLFILIFSLCPLYGAVAQYVLSLEALELFHRASLLNHYGKLKYRHEELVDIIADVNRSCEKFNVNQHLMLSIFMTESSLGRHVKGIHGGKLSDYGWGQINTRNIKRLGLNKSRLLSDRSYSIEQAVKFMAVLQKGYGSKEPTTFFSRYHSYNKGLRAVYYKRLNKWFKFMKVSKIKLGYQKF